MKKCIVILFFLVLVSNSYANNKTNIIKNCLGNYEELDTAIEYYLDGEILDEDY